ncbi:MAG: tyrosinase family protein [Ilumatobacteraceae bacterium]
MAVTMGSDLGVVEELLGRALSRRDVLSGFALGLGGLTLAALLPGCTPQQVEAIAERIRNRPKRLNVNNMASDHPMLEAYREAVTKMKALPSSDSRNWTNQASIHLNSCTHQNWFFLPWHRIYLFQFEQICATLTGVADFALPYWNWTEQPSIPAPFWSGVLNDPTRTIPQSGTMGSAVSGGVIDGVMGETNFELFASGSIPLSADQRTRAFFGGLEGTPHNSVHGRIGGDMGAFMSPLDPIFWLHHNMAEYLWVEWNLYAGHPNTNDPNWTDRSFADFFAPDGSPLTGLPTKVAWSLIYPLLAYQFERSTVGTHPAP